MKLLNKCTLALLFFINSGWCYSQGLTGVFLGEVNGDPTNITLKVVGDRVVGTYTETSNTYTIKGILLNANSFDGTLSLNSDGTELGTFKARLDQNILQMDILLLGITKLTANFSRKDILAENNLKPEKPDQKSMNNGLKPADDKLGRDPAVMGSWTKQEVMNSGIGSNAASLAIVYFLSLNSDGSFVQEKGNAGGGSDWSSVSNRALDVQGHWYTKDQVIYVRPLGQTQYQRLYPYLFHEGALVFKTDEKQYMIWNRMRN